MQLREATPEERRRFYAEEWSKRDLPDFILHTLSLREFGFDIDGTGPSHRYNQFMTVEQLGDFLRNKAPYAAYASVALYEQPSMRKGWLKSELVLDVDAKDLPLKSCGCSGEAICERCLDDARRIAIQFAETMRSDLDLRSIHFVYSVDFEEPVIIQRPSGEISLLPIGEFVEEIIDKTGDVEVLPLNQAEVCRASKLNYKAATFDPKTLKVSFKPIERVIRHPLTDKLYEITTFGGLKVRVTGSHSVFVLKEGKIETIATKDLKIGDYLVIPKRVPRCSKEMSEINLAEEFLKYPLHALKKKFKIYLNGIDLSDIERVRSFVKCETWRRWKTKGIVPLWYLKQTDQRPNISTCLLSLRNSKFRFPASLKITEELMRFCGYYVGEGHCDLKNGAYLSFGAHESEIIADALRCIARLTGARAKTYKPSASAVQLRFGVLAAIIISKIFGMGSRGRKKRLPNFIFSVNPRMQMEFVKAYYSSDGSFSIHGSGRRRSAEIVFQTISKKLAAGLFYLLVQNSIFPHILEAAPGERTFPSGHISKTAKVFAVRVSGCENLRSCLHFLPSSATFKIKKYLDSMRWQTGSSRIPIIESGLKEFHDKLNPVHRANDVLAKRVYDYCARHNEKPKTVKASEIPVFVEFIFKNKSDNNVNCEGLKDFLLRLANGDLSVVPVKRIKKVKPTKPYVYDISVKGNENFIGGFGPIALHNSGRGFHVRAMDDAVMMLEQTERAQLVEYITGCVIPADVTMALGYSRVFRERVARTFESLDEGRLLQVQGMRRALAKRLMVEKEKVLAAIRRGKLQELEGFEGMGTKTFRRLLEFLTRLNSEFTDGKVTIDTKRILRLPSSLHSGVSMKCMLVRDIERFSIEDAVPKFIREQVR